MNAVGSSRFRGARQVRRLAAQWILPIFAKGLEREYLKEELPSALKSIYVKPSIV